VPLLGGRSDADMAILLPILVKRGNSFIDGIPIVIYSESVQCRCLRSMFAAGLRTFDCVSFCLVSLTEGMTASRDSN
jgi:hypothetical protein